MITGAPVAERREREADAIHRWIADLVAKAPPLTPSQKDRIAAAMSGPLEPPA